MCSMWRNLIRYMINLHPFSDTEEIACTITPNLARFQFLSYKSQKNGGQAKEKLELAYSANIEAAKEYETMVPARIMYWSFRTCVD